MATTDVNPAALELIERRLAEKVEAQVRDRLFRFYRAIWGTATGVLAAVGVGAIVWMLDRAQDLANQEINKRVATVDAEIARAEEAIDRVEDQADDVEAALIESEEALALGRARLRESLAEVAVLASDLADMDAQFSAIEARVQETARVGSIAELREKLDQVTQQVIILDEGLGQVLEALPGEGGVGGFAPDVRSVDQAALQAIIAQPEAPPDSDGPAPGTVWFQFAGVERAVAEDISAALEAEDYEMPGEERIGSAAGKHEVRFFHAEDCEAANELAQDVNRILAGRGFASEVTAKDFTGFSGRKPSRGILELWLEPAPARRSDAGAAVDSLPNLALVETQDSCER